MPADRVRRAKGFAFAGLVSGLVSASTSPLSCKLHTPLYNAVPGGTLSADLEIEIQRCEICPARKQGSFGGSFFIVLVQTRYGAAFCVRRAEVFRFYFADTTSSISATTSSSA